jgi:hypothetical protein
VPDVNRPVGIGEGTGHQDAAVAHDAVIATARPPANQKLERRAG